jgi:hypothetical protein
MYCGQGDHFTNGCPIKLKNNSAASLSTIFLDDLDVSSATASGFLNFITLGHINTTETTTNRLELPQLVQEYVRSGRHKDTNVPQDPPAAAATPSIVQSLDPHLIVIPIVLRFNGITLNTCALLDSGASCNFISSSLIRNTGFPAGYTESTAATYRLADNSVSSSVCLSTLFMGIRGTHYEDYSM